MHVPDGFLDAPTSVATGVVAAAGVAVALRGARRELDDRTAPMAGLVATFVFAAQMMNFPVGAGTSGHLLGGALAAVLVGPWTAVLVHQRRAAGPGAAHGRRRHHRARHQHHADGLVGVGGRLARLRRAPCGCCPSGSAMVAPAAAVGALRQVPVAASSSPGCSRSAAPPRSTLGTVLDGDGRLAHRDRHRRGRDHRASWSAASSPSAPTWSTAPAPLPRPSASSRSGRSGGRDERPARFFAVGPARRAARRRRRQLLRQRRTPTGWSTSPSRPASSTRPRTPPPADSPLADYGTEGVERRARLSGGSPAWSASSWCSCWQRACSGLVRRRGRPRRRGPATDRGRRARPPAALPRPQRGPPRAGAPEAAGAARLHAGRGGHAPRVVRRLRGRTPRCCSPSSRVARVPPALPRSSGWSSSCRSWSSRCWCRSSRTARGPRCSALTVSEPGLVAAPALLVKGTLGVARLADARRDHRAARTCCAGSSGCGAGPARADHGLHDPLPRRGHRRPGADD